MLRPPFIETPIEFLKGVGPAKAELLRAELGIFTFGDLLHHFPFRHVDRTKIWPIRELDDNLPYIQVKGILSELKKEGKKGQERLSAKLSDATGYIELVWFKVPGWLMDSLKPGGQYIAFGKPSLFRNIITLSHPELTTTENEVAETGLQPVYHTTEKMKARGLDSRGLTKHLRMLLANQELKLDENLPPNIISRNKLMNRHEAFRNIHFPQKIEALQQATDRLKFEELFFMQLKILQLKNRNSRAATGVSFEKIGPQFNHFYETQLPFTLTEAQKRVLKEIRTNMRGGKHMNRLLQGDVGSGKTVVALMSMLMALDNGYQACLMAPTEVLAQQHFKSISKMLVGMDVKVSLLTGSVTQKERRPILEALSDGSLHILIGTHALIEDVVQFQNLGLVVIDEQHRFGVQQRYKLWTKNTQPPHILVMTATPIPRTLAMTLYGDLEVSVIDELPAGRIPIKTLHRYDRGMMVLFDFVKEQVRQGRQAYFVYPLIEESEKLDLQNLAEGFELVQHHFPEGEFKLVMVHGRLKPKEKEQAMQSFASNESQVMVATTVIEVGVDVPNATVMVIMSAERFGLSQLHQLRGRVGRGGEQSYCILVTGDKLGNESRKRIKTMTETTDGFKIAETDLQLRGPGDIEGTRQSGLLNLKLANLALDGQWIELTRNEALQLLEIDPSLQKPENFATANFFIKYRTQKGDWGRVS